MFKPQMMSFSGKKKKKETRKQMILEEREGIDDGMGDGKRTGP